jgi:hypothetical protein
MSDEKITPLGVVNKATSTWGHMFRALALAVGFLAVLFVGIGILVHNILGQIGPTGLSMNTAGGLAIKVGKTGTLETYLIDPHRWNSTGARVRKGDSVTIESNGSVNVALGRMIKTLLYQYERKGYYETQGQEYSVEEFTPSELDASLLDYPWAGPEGLRLEDIHKSHVVTSMTNKKEMRVLPTANLAQLLAVIAPDNIRTEDEMWTAVRKKDDRLVFEPLTRGSTKFDAAIEGKLWFIVNDIMFPGSKATLTAWEDNVGLFAVRMIIERTGASDK